MSNHHTCRICRSPLNAPFLDFGATPLANSFLKSPAEARGEASYPLAVTICPSCGLVQLTHVVPAEVLYKEYIYVSSTSEGVRAHAEALAQSLVRRYGWGPSSLVVEIASNDGTVLKALARRGVKVLGVEPARNIAALAEADGVPTVNDFFSREVGKSLARDRGKVAAILGRHVFAHIDDLHGCLEGVTAVLDDDGVLILEVPYLGDLLDKLEFDTIYHEHLSYFALGPIITLCKSHGLKLVDVERVGLHGGSVILHIRREKAAAEPGAAVEQMRRDEQTRGLCEPGTWSRFAKDVEVWKGQFEGLIDGLVRSGARLIGYGAAAKANTLLNYCPAAARSLSAILDRSPHKHGRYTPGTHIPVKPADGWKAEQATHMVILAWNFQEEIMRQMRPFAEAGGRFVQVLPQPAVVPETTARR
jgi:novobiocin biosynthesis protein NovU/D-mycarose 3-C-methyltransferase